ncbi:MAG TPA: helix-turn-helix domain-containing protein [Chloroflexia bacterium]
MYEMPELQPWLYYYRQVKRRQGQDSEILSPVQAAKHLGVRIETFKSLMDCGMVDTTPPAPPAPPASIILDAPEGGITATDKKSRGDRHRRITIIGLESVRRLRALKSSHLSLIDVSSRLGAPERMVRAFVSAGLLKTEPSIFRSNPVISEDEVHRFLARICGPVTVHPLSQGTPGVLDLRATRYAASYYKVRLPELLRAVQDGKLQAYRADERLDIWSLWFYEADLQAFIRSIELPDGRTLLARNEVLRALGCSHETLKRLDDRELLQPVVSDRNRPTALWRYDSRDVEAFQERYVTSREAATILGCASSTLDELARLGHLPQDAVVCVGRFTTDDTKDVVSAIDEQGKAYASKRKVARRFDRAALEDWLQDRITTAEAAQLLGVREERVRTWARKGFFSRISLIWYSRREILEWRDNRLSTKDVAEIFEVSPPTVARWVRLGKLTPVLCMGKNGKWCYFSRAEIERRMTEWVTIEEASSMLGVHRATIEAWCKVGKLVPDARGIKGRIWLKRADIVQLSEQRQLKSA